MFCQIAVPSLTLFWFKLVLSDWKELKRDLAWLSRHLQRAYLWKMFAHWRLIRKNLLQSYSWLLFEKLHFWSGRKVLWNSESTSKSFQTKARNPSTVSTLICWTASRKPSIKLSYSSATLWVSKNVTFQDMLQRVFHLTTTERGWNHSSWNALLKAFYI